MTDKQSIFNELSTQPPPTAPPAEAEVYVSPSDDQFSALPVAYAVQGVPLATPVEPAPATFVPPTTPNTALGGGRVPPNCPPDGVWGIQKHVGDKTKLIVCISCICFGPLGCFVLACPQDDRDVYAANGQLYDAAGCKLGPDYNDGTFVPIRRR
eukprot:CAMPEP_0197241360 /NCGR_PEP_ID=MMETSP1429-20130617/7414_1 /TAXON_ID=49237 /ORGANISM="Chaetoceros  sp., Strain UNC1202" /LENGTH=153 /DNA_ID=CAMNT_0042701183 /DNA_START=13 /DNA_END=474 /DNA_ORIENTATION=+